MFECAKTSQSFINRDEYRDKVLGCWTGKNIGGTLGGPLEGRREIFDLDFYTMEHSGNPLPNDDLDLQLAWLRAVEQNGLLHVDERLLGEYWLAHVCGPWNEYGVGKMNMVNGLYPPLSGSCNNAKWKDSNGAWIRSEIWACLFPGRPDEAAQYAWYDACVDHSGDGIYAEVFTAALESAAFIESDLRRLIEIALSKIPSDCRIARSVNIALKGFDAGQDWKITRDQLVKDSEDLGWFQAPANVGFTVLGLLYGKGDFGRSICLAVGCGDDTDCTGATAGALLGIISGRKAIPQKWIEPIGEKIQTVAIDPFMLDVPKTLDELTDRVLAAKAISDQEDPTGLRLTDGATTVTPEFKAALLGCDNVKERIWKRSSDEITSKVLWGNLAIHYENGPAILPGETKKITLTFSKTRVNCRSVRINWHLPEGWSVTPAGQELFVKIDYKSFITVEVTAGEFEGAFEYIPLELKISDHNSPEFVTVPFQNRGSVGDNVITWDWETINRKKIELARSK